MRLAVTRYSYPVGRPDLMVREIIIMRVDSIEELLECVLRHPLDETETIELGPVGEPWGVIR